MSICSTTRVHHFNKCFASIPSLDKVINNKQNLFGRCLDVERRHRPRDGLVDIDAIAGDAALAIDARDFVGTGARVTVNAVLAGSSVETP